MQSTPLEYAIQLIQSGQIDEARSALSALVQTDPQDARAWALSAWVAPDAERCIAALQQVSAIDQGGRLAKWASRKLVLVEHTGALDDEAPPLFPKAAAKAPVEEKKEKPRGPGYPVRQVGSIIVIIGVLLVALMAAVANLISQSAEMASSPATLGFVAIVIGVVVIGVGYYMDRSL